MFGLGDNDDEQRFWNYTLFKVPLTDKELEEASPFMTVVIIIAIIILIAALFIK